MNFTRSFRIGICVICAVASAAALLWMLLASARVLPIEAKEYKGAQIGQRVAQRQAPNLRYAGQVGWITVPGTDIDGAVMQAADNETYLRSNEAGQEDVWGCYFMDYECNASSQNVIVYGHSIDDSPDAARFSQLKRFLDKDFFKKNKTITLYYDGAWREYEVFSVGYADSDADRIAIVANFETDVAKIMIAAAKKRSEIDSELPVSSDAQLLTLCTCTSDGQTRFVVTAVRRE